MQNRCRSLLVIKDQDLLLARGKGLASEHLEYTPVSIISFPKSKSQCKTLTVMSSRKFLSLYTILLTISSTVVPHLACHFYQLYDTTEWYLHSIWQLRLWVKTNFRPAFRARQARTMSALSSTRPSYCVIWRQLKVGMDDLETLNLDSKKIRNHHSLFIWTWKNSKPCIRTLSNVGEPETQPDTFYRRGEQVSVLHSSAANCSGSILPSSLPQEKAVVYKNNFLLIDHSLAGRCNQQVSSIVNPKPISAIFHFYLMGSTYLFSS